MYEQLSLNKFCVALHLSKGSTFVGVLHLRVFIKCVQFNTSTYKLFFRYR